MTKQTHTSILLAGLLAQMAAVSAIAEEKLVEDARGCVSTRSLRSTEIVDDNNILFYMRGKKIYRNVLPKQCNGLARYGRFSYTTLSGSLCNFDQIRILDESGYAGRSCRLGYFYEVTEEDMNAYRELRNKPLETTPPGPAELEEISPKSDEADGSEDP